MIIYKTINLINNKIYVGQDSNNNPEYLGSGLLLKYAIEKYGLNNFKKEILQYCNNKKELCDAEIYWIKKLNSTDKTIGYNIALGGCGGDTYTNNPNLDLIKLKFKGDKNPFYGKIHTKETKEKISKTHKNKIPWNKNKTNIYSSETRRKMSDAAKKLLINIDLNLIKMKFIEFNMNKKKTYTYFNISSTTLNKRLNIIYGNNIPVYKKGEK